MRFVRPLAAATFVGLAVPALAAEPPYPTVDFQGDWVLRSEGPEMRAKLYYDADTRRMRIEMSRQGMTMTSVHDLDGREALMWSDEMPGMGMRLPIADEAERDGEPTGETKTVNGESCEIWQIADVRSCLSEQNIPLETVGDGFTATLQNIRRVTQDASLFEVPSGLQFMDLPTPGMPGADGNMPGGANMGMPF